MEGGLIEVGNSASLLASLASGVGDGSGARGNCGKLHNDREVEPTKVSQPPLLNWRQSLAQSLL